MDDRDPNIITSGLSQTISEGGVAVELAIYRLEHDPTWTLEVINQVGTSTVWDELFDTDDDAYREFRRTVETEGMDVFSDSGNVVPFRRG